MADSPLIAYINGSYSTAIQQGYKPGLTNDSVKQTGPVDCPLLSMLSDGPVAPALEQTIFVDPITAATSRPTGVPVGNEPGTLSTTVTRTPVTNWIQKIENVFSVSQEAEKIAREGGIAGNVVSEVTYDTQRKAKILLTSAELAMWSAQIGQADQRDGTNPGYIKGVFALMTTNVNKRVDTTGAAVSFTPADITDIQETDLRDQAQLCFKQGCGPLLTTFVPLVLQAAWSAAFKGRPQILINVSQNEMLNMQIESYTAACGVKVDIIPNRTMDGTCAGVLDMQQWSKRVFWPYQLVMYIEMTRNRRGYMQYAWTVLSGVEKLSGGWKLPTIGTANPS